jgi:hypothetical protein
MCGFRKGLKVCEEFLFGTVGFRNLISLLFARIFGSQYAPFFVVVQDGTRKSDKYQLLTRAYTKPNTRWLVHS